MRAISSFNREAGISTFWCRAWSAFRTLVSISATGSVNLIVCFSLSHPFAPPFAENLQRLVPRSCYCCSSRDRYRWLRRFAENDTLIAISHSCEDRASDSYHDDFETPGISPRNASCRKHKRQMPNLRRKARGRPQSLQRLCLREENLGFLASLTLFAVVAIQPFVLIPLNSE